MQVTCFLIRTGISLPEAGQLLGPRASAVPTAVIAHPHNAYHPPAGPSPACLFPSTPSPAPLAVHAAQCCHGKACWQHKVVTIMQGAVSLGGGRDVGSHHGPPDKDPVWCPTMTLIQTKYLSKTNNFAGSCPTSIIIK